jgi:2-oxoisovalerate dehydrogenase E2 component (dihydrolipoyl transacylase)
MEDIMSYQKTGGQASQVKKESPKPQTSVSPKPTAQDQVKKIGGVTKGMTKTMTDSLKTPIYAYMDDYDISNLIRIRSDLKKTHPKLTMLSFFIKAISLSLTKHPHLNINVNPETDEQGYIKEYIIKADHNIAVAIDSPHGLMVPVLK